MSETAIPKHGQPTEECQVCTLAKPAKQTVPASLVRPNLDELLRARKPDWSPNGRICLSCLNSLRNEYVREQMEKERGELSALEDEVVKAIHDNKSVVEDLNKEFDKHLTFGERLADRVAEFGGSWNFIILFFTLLGIWIVGNSLYAIWHPFDPYPFILLNLVMSLLASIQAPIIMMSQNRAAARDRLAAEHDFKVNLKAELEVRAMGEKMDQLVHNQWARLLEIQQIQMEMLEDLSGKRGR